MDTTLSQSNRVAELTTVLGGDQLVLQSLDGEEGLNRLFRFQIDAVGITDDLSLDALIGTHASVRIDSHNGASRDFDGIVTSASRVGLSHDGFHYRLVLEPWLHLAHQRDNLRIFHDKTPIEIIKAVLKDWQALDSQLYDIRLWGDYPTLEYTVQFRESDFDFVSRLMERFGISYFWEHTAGSHCLVLIDDPLVCAMLPGTTRPFQPNESHHIADEEHFWLVEPSRSLALNFVELTDYNFKTPQAGLNRSDSEDELPTEARNSSYDYPGQFRDESEARAAARVRRLQTATHDGHIRAEGDAVTLAPGLRVLIEANADKLLNDLSCLCIEARHHFTAQHYASSSQQDDGPSYVAQYVLRPDQMPIVPPRKTARPRADGPQTAFVVGDDGIDCDQFGRVLVQFHWDLDGDYSMRCRVSQSWAGPGFGAMILPRVGMEVIVEFLDGDPDRPIVTGCVYNAGTALPAQLPANKTRSMFKTNSHGGEGFNELSFEDKAGEEFIYLHAQKNLETHVLNSRMARVEFDDTDSIGNDSNLTVARNRTVTIDGKSDLTVKGELTQKTEASFGLTVGGDLAAKSKGDLALSAQGEIVLQASKITLVGGGAALVLEGGAVNVAPVLITGSANPGSAALPALPAILEAAAGVGTPFVSHCPLADDSPQI
ncbi:type VI secretion system tip protein VgrG [Paracoccus sp. M683]|uniref:type VI secretion system Vgr family protein n=1 Tax=Paracoccus sp. M683 TaxID=2594268 RepID=UPI00117E5E2F|nr:type VI secretion system tip protein TssI/VgrG [Paracoccus sp. M683]TRW95213.1 type VI secretion system tip protein VgrG [Paracoccus sp. M683]